MDAWSSQPIPAEFLHGRTALERHGALVFQAKQCHNCHSLDDKGRTARTGARQCCSAPHRRSTHSPGDSGWGKYAGLWKKSQSGGNNRTGGISGNTASGKSKASTQCFSSASARRKRGLATVSLAMSEPHAHDAVVVAPARHHIRAGGHSIGLFARLALSPKCLSQRSLPVGGSQRL